MKKNLLIFAAFLLMGTAAEAQKLIVWKTDGTQVTFDLEDEPTTTFSGSDLVLTSNKVVASYPLKDMLRYTFEDVVSTVDTQPANHGIVVRQSGDDMTFSNLAAGANVLVYDTSGKLLESHVAEGLDPLTLSFGERPKGVYIVKVDDASYKFLKK